MKDLQWFLDREFSSVVRHNKKDNTISQVDITSEKVVKYLFDL